MNKLLLIMLLAASTLLSTNVFTAKVKCEPAKFYRLYQNGDTVESKGSGSIENKLSVNK